MNNKYQIVLKIGEQFPINHKLAGLVPMATESEQTVLTEDIRQNGLANPVTLYKGEIVDGRCRQQACLATHTPIRAIELDSDLTEEEVAAYVKSVNTRRNLTTTQKAMVAARESLKTNKSIVHQAKAWGVSDKLVKNARWLWKNESTVAEKLFNGLFIELNNKTTNKITTIYAYYKAKHEQIVEDIQHGWSEDSIIKTQAGKNWYYEQIKSASIENNPQAKQLVAELANYKFKKVNTDTH